MDGFFFVFSIFCFSLSLPFGTDYPIVRPVSCTIILLRYFRTWETTSPLSGLLSRTWARFLLGHNAKSGYPIRIRSPMRPARFPPQGGPAWITSSPENFRCRTSCPPLMIVRIVCRFSGIPLRASPPRQTLLGSCGLLTSPL